MENKKRLVIDDLNSEVDLLENRIDDAEEANPINYELFYISDIISEELVPFFAGERTAEEASNVMNSRVQIYLDEK